MNDDSEIKDNAHDLSQTVISKLRDKVTDISWGIFSIGFLGTFLSIGYEGFVWLKTGEWLHLTFYEVFNWLNIDAFTPVSNIEWQGIKKIIVWFLDLPLPIGSVVFGAILASLVYVVFGPKD
jgi:hypothetical protein